jgi:hypothetical protein
MLLRTSQRAAAAEAVAATGAVINSINTVHSSSSAPPVDRDELVRQLAIGQLYKCEDLEVYYRAEALLKSLQSQELTQLR